MSNLEELIEKLCPDGVEYKTLGEVAQYAKTRIDASKMNEKNYVGVENLLQEKRGKTTASSVPVSGKVIAFESGDVLIGNIRPYLKKIWLADCAGGTNGDVLAVQINDRSLLMPEYLYYVLSSDQFFWYDTQNSKGTKMPRGSKEAVMKYNIPVPPLEVQQEIVRILDSFTELEKELEKELEDRRKQYEYYRDLLLTFKTNESTILNERTNELELSGAIRWMKLGELCNYVDYRGKTPKKVDQGIFLVTAKNVRMGFIDYEKSKEYISKDDYLEVMRRGLPKIGDLLITTEAPCGNVALVDREDIALAQRIIKYRPKGENVNRNFLKHYLLSKEFQDVLQKNAIGGTVKGIKGSKLHELKVPVPPLEVQQRIVDILDRFDTLCNDISSGLPAEIEMRQKQYEYYRDKLLSFKELKKEA